MTLKQVIPSPRTKRVFMKNGGEWFQVSKRQGQACLLAHYGKLRVNLTGTYDEAEVYIDYEIAG